MGILLTERHWLLQVLSRLSGDDDGKGRESNEHIREALAEAILYLAQSNKGRKALWDLDAPQLLRRGYEYEEHIATCEAMEQTAQLFLQDSGQLHEA